MLVGGGSVAVNRLEESSTCPAPGTPAMVNEGLCRWAGSLPLLVGKYWGLIPIGALEGWKSSGRAGEDVVGIFYSDQLFRPGSRDVIDPQVLVHSLSLPI